MKKALNRLMIILSALLAASALSADPYICLSIGGGCYMRSVSSPLYYCDGESVDLYARANSSLYDPPCDNPTYQWRHWIDLGGFINPVTISGATSNKLTVTETGLYDCVVGCSGGGYTTSGVSIYFSDPATSLLVTANPEDQSACLERS